MFFLFYFIKSIIVLNWLCLLTCSFYFYFVFLLHWLVLVELIIGLKLGYNFCFSSLLCFPLFL